MAVSRYLSHTLFSRSSKQYFTATVTMIGKQCVLNFLVILLARIVTCDDSYTVTNWKYHFPSGSGMGIYAALALPVPDSPDIDLFYAVFFEAYYLLPDNTTTYEFPPLVSDRAFGRKSLYESIQEKLVLKGYPGKNCILKAICEAASYTTLHANGVIGDLVHLLFTPSSTNNDDESYFADYKKAEKIGWNTQNCKTYNSCQINLLDLMSFIK